MLYVHVTTVVCKHNDEWNREFHSANFGSTTSSKNFFELCGVIELETCYKIDNTKNADETVQVDFKIDAKPHKHPNFFITVRKECGIWAEVTFDDDVVGIIVTSNKPCDGGFYVQHVEVGRGSDGSIRYTHQDVYNIYNQILLSAL